MTCRGSTLACDTSAGMPAGSTRTTLLFAPALVLRPASEIRFQKTGSGECYASQLRFLWSQTWIRSASAVSLERTVRDTNTKSGSGLRLRSSASRHGSVDASLISSTEREGGHLVRTIPQERTLSMLAAR